jgi:hypothetical protein
MPYLATPYTDVTGGTHHAYNFYHSHVQICIKCILGMLTQRCAILRSAIPMNERSVGKTISLVLALA